MQQPFFNDLRIQSKHAQLAHVGYPQQRGMGMVEILVTIVILALGLLGVASLQLTAASSNNDALARSQAVLVVEQFTERLRMAAVVAPNGDAQVLPNAYLSASLYNFANLTCADSALADFACFCLNVPADIPNCEASACNTAQMASFDIYQASCQASQYQPGASLSLTCIDNDTTDAEACSGGSRHVVMLRWPQPHLAQFGASRDALCNPNDTDAFACVTSEVFF
jgi:type IV pilus assembly protein PilV